MVVVGKLRVNQWEKETEVIDAWAYQSLISEFAFYRSHDMFTEKHIILDTFETEVRICAILSEEDVTVFYLKFAEEANQIFRA